MSRRNQNRGEPASSSSSTSSEPAVLPAASASDSGAMPASGSEIVSNLSQSTVVIEPTPVSGEGSQSVNPIMSVIHTPVINSHPANPVEVPAVVSQPVISSKPTQVFVTDKPVRKLTDENQFIQWGAEVEAARKRGLNVDRNNLIHKDITLQIDHLLQLHQPARFTGRHCWESWDDTTFFQVIPALFVNAIASDHTSLLNKLGGIRAHFDPNSRSKHSSFIWSILEVLHGHGYVQTFDNETAPDTMDVDLRKRCQRKLIENITLATTTAAGKPFLSAIQQGLSNNPASLGQPFANFFRDYLKEVDKALDVFQYMKRFSSPVQPTSWGKEETTSTSIVKPRNNHYNPSRQTTIIAPSEENIRTRDDGDACDGCGRPHKGGRPQCWKGPWGVKQGKLMLPHPDFNYNGSWESSKIGRAYSRFPKPFLTWGAKLNSSKNALEHLERADYVIENSMSSKDSRAPAHAGPPRPSSSAKRGERSPEAPPAWSSGMSFGQLIDSESRVSLFFYSQEEQMGTSTRALIDSGADHSMISADYAKEVESRLGVNCHKIPLISVSSCFGEHRQCECQLVINARIVDSNVSMSLSLLVVPDLREQVIIGRDMMNRLIKVIESEEVSQSGPDHSMEANVTCDVNAVLNSSNHVTPLTHRVGSQPVTMSSSSLAVNCNHSHSHSQTNSVVHGSTRVIDVYEGKDDHSDTFVPIDYYDDSVNPLPVTQSEMLSQIRIYGPDSIQMRIRRVVNQFRSVFSLTVKTHPARVKPMTIQVDQSKWHNMKGNTGPPRQQSVIKDVEIQRQCNELLALGVIRVSDSPYHSQVNLVPKPNGKWRLTIDYRLVNECTMDIGGVLPNIQNMLQRIGRHRPTFFGVMDLTSGFHQMALSESSRQYTAFITSNAVYEFNRVSMGLKGSPAHFQRAMVSEVLNGMIYTSVEMYIDDCIVYGRDEDQFIERLTQVLTRFRERNITLNPSKCQLGLSEIEYVGHTINSQGIAFSQSKLDSVMQHFQPQSAKELSSFLGVTSYFRDHVKNYALLEYPLRHMLKQFKEHRQLQWSEETTSAFQSLKEAINQCPRLFFVDDTLSIIVYTDASQHGIGGCVVQVKDGKEIPIAFMSKLFNDVQSRWSTIEKECYAIVATITKHEYLLRDRQFILRTDHRNLTYLNDAKSDKVYRWRLEIQSYSFKIEYIQGEKNVVADGLSRLFHISTSSSVPVQSSDTIIAESSPTDSTQSNIVNINAPSIAIPEDKYAIINAFHNHLAGHRGVKATVRKLKEEGHTWDGLTSHVTSFIDQCPTCQKLSTLSSLSHSDRYTLATLKMSSKIAVDTLMVGQEDNKGNKYIIVILDTFTRWIELFPVPNLEAQTAVDIMIQHFGRYGIPHSVVTDNGSQFINSLFDQLYSLTGISQIRITPYSHEENGMVERSIREVLRHLRCIVSDRRCHHRWSSVLPMVQRIMNTTINTVTQVSPAQLVYGTEANLNQSIFPVSTTSASSNNSSSTTSMESIIAQRQALQAVALDVAQTLQRERDERHIAGQSQPATEFPLQSLVLVNPPSGILQPHDSKLHTYRSGPMRVIARNGDTYSVLDLVKKTPRDVHVSRLVPFIWDEKRVNPHTIALQDSQEFVIETIIDHVAGNSRNKNSYEFRVRWEGYGPEEDQWLAYQELKDTEQLAMYMWNNNLRQLMTIAQRKRVHH